MTLSLALLNPAYPDRLALEDGREALLYKDLADAIAEKTEVLLPYTCVGLALDNSVAWVLWDLAALLNGVTLVPLPPFFTPDQTAHALASAGAQALITAAGLQALSHAPRDLPAQTAKITYTSGTTGTPKGVCLSRTAMIAVAQSLVDVLHDSWEADLAVRHCAVLPLGVLLENVAGVYATLLAGGTVLLPSLKEYDSDYANLHAVLKQNKASSAILVPEILRSLIGQVVRSGPLSALRFLAVGGAAVAPALITQARALGLPVYEGYGLSECGSVVSLNTPGHDKPGSTGRVLPHVTVSCVDGEIIINNPGFLGYVGQPQSGAFATGDLGTQDKEGFLSLSGRKKNVLITSYGRNVSPEWVESVLLTQPEIAQAFVYGEAQPHLSALLVPVVPEAPLAEALARANRQLPDYAQVHDFDLTLPFTIADATLTGNGRLRRDVILQTRLKNHLPQETHMTFYERLTAETESARQELYSVPQLIDGLRGDISRDTYIAYLTEAYHHVSHTVRFLMAMGARLPESKTWLHDAIAEYIEEEKGHEEWILNDIAAAGGNKEKARMATPNLETQVLIAYNYDYIARKNPVGFFGMVFMLESTSIQIANHGAEAVKAKLGLPQTAFTYLYSHGALDIQHMKFFEQLVNQIDDPQDQAAIIEVAQNTFRLFANVMRAIPHEKALKNAA